MTLPIENAAVIGLGLIGGSMARDLVSLGVRVSAFDADVAQLDAAVADGVVTQRLDATLEGISTADLVVIAVPVDEALDVLRRVAPLATSVQVITDVGSTKLQIAVAARGLELGGRFVGSHPMAGDHRSGWAASRAGLFVDAPVYVCTDGAALQPLRMVHDLWKTLGARTIEMDAEEHDHLLAWTSHLPHMTAVALALTLGAGGVSREDLGPGGRDMTRIAGSSPEMWTAIALQNAWAIESSLAVAEREIASMRAALSTGDRAALHRTFTAARAWFHGETGDGVAGRVSGL